MEYVYSDIEYGIKSNKFNYIGEGSGRIIYDLDDGYVIKFAKNKKGIAQNKTECELFFNYNNEIFAPILEASEDYKYLIMRKAERLNSFRNVLEYFDVKSKEELFKIPHFQSMISTCQLSVNDLTSKTSWGIIDDVPKIIDYGLTHKVYTEYYMNNKLLGLLVILFLIRK